jgi:hypothetical protein
MEQNANENKGLAVLQNDMPQLMAILRLNAPNGTDVQAMVISELSHLQYIGITKPEIFECDPESIKAAVRKTFKDNLSLDPDAGLVYVTTRNVNVTIPGTNPKQTRWVKVLETKPSAEGLISMNRQRGRILDIKRPEIIYNEKKKVIAVTVEVLYPSYPNPRWETYKFEDHDFFRWKSFSHRQNSIGKQLTQEEHTALVNANRLYTAWNGGIDPEFARAKAIRHILKKLGSNANEKGLQVHAIPPAERIIDKEADKAAHIEELDYEQIPDEQTNNNAQENTSSVSDEDNYTL